MLHYSTIEPKTLDLLKKIQSNDFFSATRLVGGTALAMQIGHRKSIDLDFFGNAKLTPADTTTELKKYGPIVTRSVSNRIQRYIVCGIQLDFVEYEYPWLNTCVTVDGIRLAAKKDIAAMKLSAITNRGSRKDFVDLAFLLKKFSLSDMLQFYIKKFSDGEVFSVLKSLVYFNDAEEEPMPNMLAPFDWNEAKAHIRQAVAAFSRDI